MRKNLYILKHSALLLVMMLMANSLIAADITWTGEVSTDASVLANWDPQQAITDADVVIIDTASVFNKITPNWPVFSGSDSIYVSNLLLSQLAEMTLDFDAPEVLFSIATETPQIRGFIHIEEGVFIGRRLELNDTIGAINIHSGGTLLSRKYLFMSDGGGGRDGSYVNMFGTGKVVYNADQGGFFGRFPNDTTTGIYTLDTLSTMELATNNVDLIYERVAKNQVVAAEGYDIVAKYDPAADYTYVYCRDKLELVVEPGDNQFIIANQPGTKLEVVKNEGYDEATVKEWKWSTTSGSGYQSFNPVENGDTLVPQFADAGKYFVVFTGNGTFPMSNEVTIFVGTDKVLISPNEPQYLRADLSGAMLTATVDVAITSQEWKWSNTPGEGHVSFTSPATGLEFTPSFDATGVYYVVCVGKDAGDVEYQSSDVVIYVDEAEYDIYWNGEHGNSGTLAANWDPISSPDNNRVRVGAPDTYQDSLIFSGGNGNIYVRRIYIEDTLSTMSVDMGSDTLRVSSGSTYGISGELIVSSGVLSYTDLRHAATGSTGRIIVKNTGEFLIRSSYFMMGNSNNPTHGCYIDIMDDGKFISIANQPARFHITDTTKSVITISGNGMLQVPGDWRGGAETVMATLQLRAGSEEEELVVTYPVVLGEDTVTQVTAKSIFEFEIEPLDDQVVAVGEAVSTLSTINDDDRTGLQWKYASASGGPYMAFSPPAAGNTFSGSFDAAGDYFVICEGYATDTVMSSEVAIQVIGVSIAPADAQNIAPGTPGTALTVTESATADSREWKSTTTSGSGYTAVVPPQSGASYSPLFLAEGIYYVVCASTFGDKTINSNEVTVVVESVSVEDNMAKTITIYPNPAQQEFYLDAGDYNTYRVKVMDLTGRSVYTNEYVNVNGPQKIELNHQGIYFVEISTAEGTHTAKMIIK